MDNSAKQDKKKVPRFWWSGKRNFWTHVLGNQFITISFKLTLPKFCSARYNTQMSISP